MQASVARYLISGVAALFSLYLIALGVLELHRYADARPVVVALVLYATATAVSLYPRSAVTMPVWMAAFNLGVVIVITLVVSSNLNPNPPLGLGYATWHVGAAGTLLAITAARRRFGFAWAGAVFLLVQNMAWAGPGALVSLGVIGSVAWVGVAHLISTGIATAAQDAQRFAIAEREATQWQAAQDAHFGERQFRLGQTSSMALRMLRQIESSGGNLTAQQRQECLTLEAAIRDEIRGRGLLSDDVRRAVMRLRRAGVTVTLLDEGGIDDLNEAEIAEVHAQLAEALGGGLDSEKVIVRTVPDDRNIAVTVVGVRGDEDAEDAESEAEVALWVQLARPATASEA